MICNINRWNGRFGNNLFQLAFAIFIAETNKGIVKYPNHNIIKRVTFDFINKHDFQDARKTTHTINSDFYFCPYPNIYRVFNHPNIIYDKSKYTACVVQNIFQSQLTKCVQIKNTPNLENTLVIHLRGGDIFIPSAHSHYVQPPLSFYTSIIKEFIVSNVPSVSSISSKNIKNTTSIKKVLIVTEDYKNPCVSRISEYCTQNNIECSKQISSILNDFSTLVNSHHLVLSNSTFSYAAYMFNRNCKNVFIPVLNKNKNKNMQFDNIKNKHLCKTHLYYFEKYIDIGEWNKNSIDLLLTYSEDNINTITLDNQE